VPCAASPSAKSRYFTINVPPEALLDIDDTLPQQTRRIVFKSEEVEYLDNLSD
jgi:hypothetical protein